MTQLKLRKTGNSLSTIWPKEFLSRLNVKEGRLSETCLAAWFRETCGKAHQTRDS